MPPIPTTEKRPFIPAQGVMQLEMVFTYLGQVCENVYHVLQGDGATAPTLAEMNALAAAMENFERTTGRLAKNQNATLDHIKVTDLTTQTGPAIERVPSPAIVGADTTTPAPGNVTWVATWHTALRGRSFRGRTYHVGLSLDQVNGNQLSSGTLANFVAQYAALLSAVNGVAGCTMGVLSYAHNKFWRDAALFTPITAVTGDNNLDSQRRRLAGRGA